MNLLRTWLRPAAPLPPCGVEPTRYGNGRVEIRIYPGATTADRLAAARALLHATAWRVALAIEDEQCPRS